MFKDKFFIVVNRKLSEIIGGKIGYKIHSFQIHYLRELFWSQTFKRRFKTIM